jgi:meso-butanediol dehydrogenase / (S,S)-butanediol dehydrogenase / diacetyl reductase
MRTAIAWAERPLLRTPQKGGDGMGRLEGKGAVVTGSSSGIGKATAELFAREGAKVVVLANRNVEGGREVVDAIRLSGGEAIFIQADVSKEADCRRIMDAAVEAFGRLDILVNNAAIERLAPSLELTEADFYAVIDTNLKGVCFCCKYAIPYMKQAGGGAIVTVSSRAAFMPTNIAPIYCASKAAALSWTQAIAHEHAKDNIRANTVIPSNIWTNMARGYIAHDEDPEKTKEWFEHSQVMGRAGEPEEVAYAILFLASDEASFITSTPLLVDGGFFFTSR